MPEAAAARTNLAMAAGRSVPAGFPRGNTPQKVLETGKKYNRGNFRLNFRAQRMIDLTQ